MSRGAAYGGKAVFYLTHNKHGCLFNVKKDAPRYAFQVSLLTYQSLHSLKNGKKKEKETDMSYSFLKPVKIGNMILKNRVIVPAMARYLCKDGFVTDAYVEYLRAMAEGGVAMVTVGIMPIDLNWPSTMPTQPCLGDDKYIPGLTRAVAAIHAGGAKASLQPWMPGRAPYTYANAVERAQDIAIVNRLTVDEIHNIQRKYAAAALRCAMAGADVVEWHNAHNYLGEQFYSPYFNHRTDEYGQQSVENSMRFARETITLTRKTLDAAGYTKTKIVVSNALDEYLIRDLLSQGACIDTFGVGERLITARSEPVFGGVYKLVAVEHDDGTVEPKIKISENVGKITNPHFKKLYRFYGNDTGKAIADYMCVYDETVDDGKDLTIFDPEATWKQKTVYNFTARELQVPIFRGGELVYTQPTLEQIRDYCREQVETLWDEVKRFDNPHSYYVDLSQKLWDIKYSLLKNSAGGKNAKE